MVIIGYTFQAETYCPDHIVAQVTVNPGNAHHRSSVVGNAERHLDLLARIHPTGPIDRYDERTFDSGDFPKVIFSTQVEDDEQCAACGRSI